VPEALGNAWRFDGLRVTYPSQATTLKELSRRAIAFKRSAIRILFDEAGQRTDLIRLEIGEPSFTTPAGITEAAYHDALNGFTHYPPTGGYASLREAISRKLASLNQYAARPDQVVVTAGGTTALISIYSVLLNEGDEVLLPSPGFPNMDQMVRFLGGIPVFYSLIAANGFLPERSVLERLVTPKTKVIFINTPANPTGAVYPQSLVQDLVSFAQKHDLWLISDEVYEELIYDHNCPHTSAARFDSDGRVISVYSLSKTYAMTGWRIGYCVAQPQIAELVAKLELHGTYASSISQRAAQAALTGPQTEVRKMVEAYRNRRDLAWQTALDHHLRAVRPQGAIYMFIDISPARLSSLDFALLLLKSKAVVVAPGSVFGPGGDGYVRICLAAEEADIITGLGLIGDAVNEMRDAHPTVAMSAQE
jgi:aspartate aminotransferase